MRISILHNCDYNALEEDPGREARKDVLRVAGALAEALDRNGVSAEPLAIGTDSFAFLEALRSQKPQLVINLCESLGGDSRGEMTVPCLLELLGIPYTGSSSLALGLALHKDKAKHLLQARSIPTPEFALLTSVDEVGMVNLDYPLIVKPVREDASVGVDFDSVVHNRQELRRAAEQIHRQFHQAAIAERFIPGREIYVALLGNRPRRILPLTEIQFGKAFENRPNILSYRAKWDLSSSECIDSPARRCALDAETESRVVQVAVAAFEALDCRDYGRVDVRLNTNGQPYVIDVNPNCDLHPDAGFAQGAAAAGIDYSALAKQIVEIALARSHGNSSNRRTGSERTRRAAGPNRDLLSSRGSLRRRAHRPRAEAE